MTTEDLKTLEPAGWKIAAALKTWKWSENVQVPSGFSELTEASSAVWVCGTAGTVGKVLAAQEREIACLAAIARPWIDYVSIPRQVRFDRARILYAYAATALGPDARARIDAALAGLPAAAPTGGLRTGKELLAHKSGKVTAAQLYAAFHAAGLADPDTLTQISFAQIDLVGKPNVDMFPIGARLGRKLDVCAFYPGKQPSSLPGTNNFTYVANSLEAQLMACSSLVNFAWSSYQTTGNYVAYNAASAAFRYGYSRTIKDCGGRVCVGEWVDGIKHFVK